MLFRPGNNGQGTASISNGATLTSPNSEIGEHVGSVGQVTLSTGGSLHITEYLSIGTGYNPTFIPAVNIGPNGGTGKLTINSGSSATVTLQMLLGNGGTLELSGGGTMAVGNIGATIPTAGSVLIGAGGTISGTGTIHGVVVNSAGEVQPAFHRASYTLPAITRKCEWYFENRNRGHRRD